MAGGPPLSQFHHGIGSSLILCAPCTRKVGPWQQAKWGCNSSYVLFWSWLMLCGWALIYMEKIHSMNLSQAPYLARANPTSTHSSFFLHFSSSLHFPAGFSITIKTWKIICWHFVFSIIVDGPLHALSRGACQDEWCSSRHPTCHLAFDQ